MRIVATAGHVDHGKTTLLRALTGIDADRLIEEQERGLTIDIGFAWTDLPSDTVAFVDVPGHNRFIKNMLAGVGPVRASLFVVAAPEGWKAQSEEHLRILDVLGFDDGVVALTKADLLGGEDELEIATLLAADELAGSCLERAPIVPVDAISGTGMQQLRQELDALVRRLPPVPDRGRPRLWIDRVFAAKGSGTVVTGTLTDGALELGETLEVQPAGLRVRVRALESLHARLERATPGSRVAVNLTGVDHDRVQRGDVLVRPDDWHRATAVDVGLRVVGQEPIGARGAWQVHIGTGAYVVRTRVLGGAASIEPGDTGHLRIYLPTPLPLLPGDRFVLRELGRQATVGGGEILDVEPVLPARRAAPSISVERVVEEHRWLSVGELRRLTGEEVAPTVGSWVVAPAYLEGLMTDVRRTVTAAGPIGVDLAGLDERHRTVVALADDLRTDAGRVFVAGGEDVVANHPFLAALRAELFTPPAPEGVDRVTLRELVRRQLVFEHEGVYFAAEAVAAVAAILQGVLAERPEGLTVAEVRDLLGSSRRFILPLLAVCDQQRVTRRNGDQRVAGAGLAEWARRAAGGGGRESNPPDGEHPSQPL